jgi:predicted transcriptional regulator
MITVELDAAREEQLRCLAESRREEASQLVRRLIEEFLDIQAWGKDSEEAIAQASITMLAEVIPPESWDEGGDEPR